jgi:short-subunit dehydrogenase
MLEGRGRWVLVTGASAGIGAAFARVFAEHGFGLVLTARREERLRAVADELGGEHGVETLVVPADLSDPAAPQTIVDAVGGRGIDLHALVNNAGYGNERRFEDTPWEDHAAFIQVLVTSLVHLTHLLLPEMQRLGYGRIINVASVAGLMPGTPRRTLYGASKSFVIKFSEALAAEQAGRGIHVCAVCPGFTYSEFHDVVGNRDKVSQLPRWLWMDAETVAREGYAAVMEGKPVWVNGLPNKALTTLMRLAPQPLLRALLERQTV